MQCLIAQPTTVNISVFTLFITLFLSATISVFTYVWFQRNRQFWQKVFTVIQDNWRSQSRRPSDPSVPYVIKEAGLESFSLSGNNPKTFTPPEAPKLTVEQEVEAFETSTSSKLIVIHHSESSSIFSSGSSIDMREARNFVDTLRKTDSNRNLTIILNTFGGSIAATEVIVNAIGNHQGMVNIYVPFSACSGGTVIALSGSRLFLGKNAFLGPFDPVFGYGFSAKNLLSAFPSEPETYGFFAPVVRIIRGASSRALQRVYRSVDKVTRTFPPESSSTIQGTFVDSDVDHDTPFFYEDLRPVLNNYVENGVPDNVYDIYDKYLNRPTHRSSSISSLLSMLGM